MKIRGTPAHIAEKYLTLARDAQSSGDPVLAENYLQHAEHYNRIIMAYREQFQQPGGADMPNGNGQRLRGPNDPGEGEDFGDDEGGDDMADEVFAQPPVPQHQGGQPQHQGRQQGYDSRDRPFRRDQGRFRDRDRYNDRNDRGDRNADRGDRDRGDRTPHEGRPAQPPQQDRQPEAPTEAGGGGDQRRRDRFQQPHEQPEFLRRPVRRQRTENGEQATPSKEEPRE